MGRLLATTGPITALTCACVAITLANSCRADAINSWQGASASVDAGGKQATDAGATASASTGGTYTLSSAWGAYWNGGPYPLSIPINSGGSASASGNPDNLLTASTYLKYGPTGVLSAPIVGPDNPIQATASWNNDSLIVHAPPGTSLPDSVQLQFKVDVLPGLPGAGGENGSLSIGINGNNTQLTGFGFLGAGLPGGGEVGGVKLQPIDSELHHQTGTFNIALALHPNGVSDPFSLSVSSIGSPAANLNTFGALSYASSISLSLTGVTLPDGTPLTAAGYGGSFASGMALPVPEPATFVVWGLLAVAAVTLRHRALTTRAGR
jgi:hypothetical protein